MVNTELVSIALVLLIAAVVLLYYLLGRLQEEHNALLKATSDFISQLHGEHQALLNTQKSLFESVQAVVALLNAPSPGQVVPSAPKRPNLSVVGPQEPEDPTAA